MPIVRFRTLEEANREPTSYPPGGENLLRLTALLGFAYNFVPRRRFPAGVFRYPSLDAAQAARESWITSATGPAPKPWRPAG